MSAAATPQPSGGRVEEEEEVVGNMLQLALVTTSPSLPPAVFLL